MVLQSCMCNAVCGGGGAPFGGDAVSTCISRVGWGPME